MGTGSGGMWTGGQGAAMDHVQTELNPGCFLLLCLTDTPTSLQSWLVQTQSNLHNSVTTMHIQTESRRSQLGSSVCLSTLQPTHQQFQLMGHSMPQFRPAALPYTFASPEKPQNTSVYLISFLVESISFLAQGQSHSGKNHSTAYIQARMTQLAI